MNVHEFVRRVKGRMLFDLGSLTDSELDDFMLEDGSISEYALADNYALNHDPNPNHFELIEQAAHEARVELEGVK